MPWRFLRPLPPRFPQQPLLASMFPREVILVPAQMYTNVYPLESQCDLDPTISPGKAPREQAVLKEVGPRVVNRQRQREPQLTSSHLAAAASQLLTNSRARRKARGSFNALKVPAEASYG